MTLRDVLLAILAGGIAPSVVVYALVEHAAPITALRPAQKRMLTAVLSGLIGLAAWGLAVFLGYVDAPATRAAVAESVWAYGVQIGLAAFTGSSLIHGARHLRTR